MAKKSASSGLAAIVGSIKADDKAKKSPSTYLRKVIDDYCLEEVFDPRRNRMTTLFDFYLSTHADDLKKYIDTAEGERKGRFRGSAAGKCPQQQAYDIVYREAPTMLTPGVITRPARQIRALYNGTFGHVRWHMMFDALHERGLVRTIFAEEHRLNVELDMSGTLDRMIEFEFENETLHAVLDFKTMKARYFELLTGPNEDHMLQHHSYDKLDFKADFWMMLYENKDTHDLKIYDTPYSEVAQRKLVSIYEKMTNWIEQFKRGDVQRIELPLVVDWCRYCPWQKPCAQEHPDLTDQQSRVGDAE